MKHTLVLAALAGAVFVGMFAGDAAAQNAETRSLRAENNLLRKQVASLKAKLEAALARTVPKTEPKPPKHQPTTPKTETPPQATAEGFQVRLHENNEKWWTDPSLLMYEIAVRELISGRHPEQSVFAWLKRQNYFAGCKLTWEMDIRSVRDVSGISARTTHRRSQRGLDEAKRRIEQSRRNVVEAGKSDNPERLARSKTDLENALASFQREQANLVMWERLDKARGGAIVHLSLGGGRHSESRISVQMALMGDAAIKIADIERRDKVTVSGKVTRMWVDGRRNISLAVDGALTQVKRKDERKDRDRPYRPRRHDRPEERWEPNRRGRAEERIRGQT